LKEYRADTFIAEEIGIAVICGWTNASFSNSYTLTVALLKPISTNIVLVIVITIIARVKQLRPVIKIILLTYSTESIIDIAKFLWTIADQGIHDQLRAFFIQAVAGGLFSAIQTLRFYAFSFFILSYRLFIKGWKVVIVLCISDAD